MKETVRIQFDKLILLSNAEINLLAKQYLFWIYENKYEIDKLHINFEDPKLEALIRIIEMQGGVSK